MFTKIPLDRWVESIISWLNTYFAFLFDFFSSIISGIVGGFTFLFHAFPALIVIVVLTLLAYYFGRWRLALFAVLGLLLILNLGYWDPTMDTLALGLADPKNAFGGDEEIHTIGRLHLQTDQPSAYQFLDNFQWKPADMEQVMVKIQEGQKPEEAAAQWVEANPDKVNAWISGIPKVGGEKLKLAYVAWDSEISSTNVVNYVLENKLGYQVDMLQVEAGPMWAGIASGDADAMVAGWLPTTHKDYEEKFKGKFEDLGPNLIGTKLGLVVPKYMNLTSIEDLVKK